MKEYVKNYKTTITGIIITILGIIISFKDAVTGTSLIAAGAGFIVAKDGDK